MQTFLTSKSFSETARSLDNLRLNKQALEAWQILMTNLRLTPDGLPRQGKGWVSHPAVKMWTGCDLLLLDYIGAMVLEWERRGFKSTIADKATETIQFAKEQGLLYDQGNKPEWMSNQEILKEVTSSHRRALLVKNYDWYKQFGWSEDVGTRQDSYEYVWVQSGVINPLSK